MFLKITKERGGGVGRMVEGREKRKKRKKEKKSDQNASVTVSTNSHHKMRERKERKEKKRKRLREEQCTTQVQLRSPTRADELPFVDARYCKSSSNSSTTSRSSRRGNQKRWNNPSSSYTSRTSLPLAVARIRELAEAAGFQTSSRHWHRP